MSDPKRHELRRLLSISPDANEAVAAIYRHLKKHNPKISMASICMRAGLRSTGFFSDLVNGKKPVGRKYIKVLAKAFALRGLDAEFLDLLILASNSKGEEKQNASARLEEIRRMFSLPMGAKLPPDANIYFTLFVLSCFSIFGGKAERDELVDFLGKERFYEVDRALSYLTKNGYLKQRGKRFEILKTRVIFGKSEDGANSHIDFLRSALQDAASSLDTSYGKDDEAFYLSTFVSIRLKDLKEKIPMIKRSIMAILTQLESESESDSIAKFNLQLFPFKK